MNGDDDGMMLPDLRRTRAERWAARVTPAAGVAWTAAEIMRFAGVHATRFAGVPVITEMGIGTGVAAAIAWGVAGRRDDVPESLPWWIIVTGGWMTAAADLGPLHWWPYPILTVAWAVITWRARHAAHHHRSVTDAREWREARQDWLMRRNDWGLGGSHLDAFQRTRLGELYEVNTKGTGHRASHFIGGHLEEVIAEAEDLAPSRVRVMGHRHGLAGRIRISIRRIDPWADVLLHPLVCDEHEIELPVTRSILDEAIVGQDPETGEPLTIPLYDENGARRVSVTANSGGGKGVLEDDLFEHVTACDDAVAVHLNLSVKGYEDVESWGPACHLTAYGPEQIPRAVLIMQAIERLLEWRTRNFKRGQYKPSREHPAVIVFADESDTALAAVRAGLNMIATKGRSHGVGYVHLGQRNTRDYVDPKGRSQDNVFCTGMVRNANEDRHAGTGTGPSMATYGDGRPGVWKIERLGGGQRIGRTWVFSADPARHGAEVEAIAQERAFDQPELPAACRAYLGEEYEELLKTEVFARWAQANGYGDPDPEADDGTGDDDGGLTAVVPPPPGPARAEAAVPVAAGTVLAEEDPLRRWEETMGGRERERIERIAAKLGGARRTIEEISARPARPQVAPEVLAARVAEDWHTVGVEAVIPEDARARLLEMLGTAPSAADRLGGTTIRLVAEEFGLRKWTARTWLQKFRDEGLAYVDGARSAARWRRVPDTPPGGDAPSPPGA